MTTTVDMHRWTLVGRNEHPGLKFISSDVEYTDLLIVPGRLRRRPARSGRECLSVGIQWATFTERFSIRVEEALSFRDGDTVLVLISTETSTNRGCTNGWAQLHAVQIAPGIWAPQRPRP